MDEIVYPRGAVMVGLRVAEFDLMLTVVCLTSACSPTSDWAISLSWCGNARSIPPECMSMLLPRTAEAITEHSICHPGRPGPHGEGHDGSPALDAFHKAKSEAERADFEARAPEPLSD